MSLLEYANLAQRFAREEAAKHEGWETDTPGWEMSFAPWERRPVCEFLMMDGAVRRGVFELQDTVFDGESTCPIWYVTFEGSDSAVSYYDDIVGWRRTDEEFGRDEAGKP